MSRHHISLKRPISLLTAPEVSARLGIPLQRLYKLASTGDLPAVKLGRHWRFPRKQLQAWVKAQTARQLSLPGLNFLSLAVLLGI